MLPVTLPVKTFRSELKLDDSCVLRLKMEPAPEKVLNEAATRNLELVCIRGSQSLSDTMPKVSVTGEGSPPNGEVVTRYPLSAKYMLRASVDFIVGQSTLSFGLIVPDHRSPEMLELRDGEHLQGNLWAWNSKSQKIYRKPFDSWNAFNSTDQIMYHNCEITRGGILNVYRNFKTNTVHFVINGKEQKVSISGEGPDHCYGYLRLCAKGGGSKVQVKLLPVINEAYFASTVPSPFGKLGRAILEVLGLQSLVTSVPVNGNQVQVYEEIAEEPEPKPEPDLEPKPEPEPEPEPAQLSCYDTNKRPRGICLIINNVPNVQHEEQQLVDLFRSLAFDVQVRQGLQKFQIYRVAREFARKKDHSQFNLFVCILMSVCKQDHQFSDVDGQKVTIEEVTSEYVYNVDHCSSLKNIPKLFFVQKFAMAKSKLMGNNDRSAQVDGSTVKGRILFSPCTTFEGACPKEADFLLCSVTSPLDETQQVPESSFIKVLVKVIRQYSHLNHLLEMLVKVNEQLGNTQIGQPDKVLPVQVPYLTHTLRSKVFLELDPPVDEPLSGPLLNPCGTEQLNQPQQGSNEIRNKFTLGRNTKYEITRRPRGICLILNNIDFPSEKREGAEFDERELIKLFKELFFTVHAKRNLRYDEMRNATGNFAKNIDYKKYDAFVLIVMSHGGDRDVIYGVDNRVVRVEDLMSEFTEANCPGLRGKPKLFFVQTCRGSLRESMSSTGDNADGAVSFSPVDSTLPRSVFPNEPHMLLAFATAPGYVAWRNPQSGSLFIQVLVQAIRKFHHREHVLDILTEVTRLVVDIGIKRKKTIQVPAPTHTLTAQLYL